MSDLIKRVMHQCIIIVCQSWLSAGIGFGSVHVCVICLCVCLDQNRTSHPVNGKGHQTLLLFVCLYLFYANALAD